MFRLMNTQTSMDESHLWIPEFLRKRLETTWPHIFRKQVLTAIPESAFASLFHEFMGRPNFPVAILVALSILKEMLDLTDEALMESFRFDLRFHYALGLRLEDTELSVRTLYYFRKKVVESQAISETFEQVTDKIIAILSLHTGEQRLDSTHIRSNMANLTRLGLFTKTIEQFLARLEKSFPKHFEALPKRFKERYGERPGYFADVKGTQSQRRLGVVAKDLWALVDRFRANTDVRQMPAYKLLSRLLDEQCIINTNDKEEPVVMKKSEEITSATCQNPSDLDDTSEGDEELGKEPVTLKEPKDVASDTLQNPSDPDATYDGHKGKGYQVQICETCHKDNPIQVITLVDVEQAHLSDQHATISTIDALDERGHKPERLFTDTSYNSGENLLEAAERGVELMAPTPGKADMDTLNIFDFNIDYGLLDVEFCPAGFQPIKNTVGSDGETHNLLFDRDKCAVCDMAEECPAGRQNGRLRVHPTNIAIAYSRLREGTDAFKEDYKIRSGIEATNAEGKTAHGLDKVWSRELPRVTFAGIVKTLAINVKRFVHYQCVQILKVGDKPSLNQV
jgi:hypothetical protein